MIEELRIHSLGVIEESVLELGPGFSVITGETGAGKTMLVTALGLLRGSRADTRAVRTGARAARVEGTVRAGPELAEAIDALGGEVEDDTALLVRQIGAQGRSRAFVGGSAVPVSALAGLTDDLVAVHGQSDQHRLLRPGAQRDALDAFAGEPVGGLRREYGERFDRLKAVESELREVVDSARERAREADLLRLGRQEVGTADPQPGEDEALAGEESRLGYADALRTAAETARTALSADEGPDAVGAVATARQALEGVAEHDREVGGLAERLAELGYLLTDLAGDVASYATGLETDPARLAAVSERRSVLGALTRKYGDTVEEVLAWAMTAEQRLTELDGSDQHADHLRAESADLREQLTGLAERLHEARSTAASDLAERVTAELAALAMPHASVEVCCRRLDRFTPSGVDEVEILLAANAGMDALPLHKGASGGELSRVMLALEVVLAGSNPVPTFVFDEVDAGVGGRAAVEVGRRLAALARSAQVLVVTHLPQVAAFADRHVVVRKTDDGSVTTSGLTLLDDDGRVQELSRMLAGLEDSDTALAHAQELLQTAREAAASPGAGARPRARC
ncbi:MAG: DNA repair protein RecN [Marmoricola sp.]